MYPPERKVLKKSIENILLGGVSCFTILGMHGFLPNFDLLPANATEANNEKTIILDETATDKDLNQINQGQSSPQITISSNDLRASENDSEGEEMSFKDKMFIGLFSGIGIFAALLFVSIVLDNFGFDEYTTIQIALKVVRALIAVGMVGSAVLFLVPPYITLQTIIVIMIGGTLAILFPRK